MHVPIAPEPLPDELRDDFFSFDSPVAPSCLGEALRGGAIPRAHAPGGGMAQGGLLPAVPVERSQVPNSAEVYPDSGSIKIRRDSADPVPEVMRDFPHLLVGTGRIKGPFCGTFHAGPGRTVGACATQPGKHKPVLIPNSCKRRECPECYPSWINHAKRRASGILNGYLNAKLKGQRRIDPTAEPDYLPVHVSFHPPRELIVRLVKETRKELEGPEGITPLQFHQRFIEKFRRECDRIIQGAGVTGYIEIYHSIRLKKDRDNYEADAMQDLNRYRDILDFPDWEKSVKFSPHAHILCFGYIRNSEELCEETGWTYRRHRVVSNAEALVYYLLSHAPAIERKHNIRYCGSLNKHRLMVEGEIIVPDFPDCPECLEAGGKPGQSGYVIAKLSGVTYQKNERGKNQMSGWGFEIISHKPYRQTERIKIYRILKIGEKPDRSGLSKLDRYLPKQDWDKLSDTLKMRFQFKQYYTLPEFAALPVHQQPERWV